MRKNRLFGLVLLLLLVLGSLAACQQTNSGPVEQASDYLTMLSGDSLDGFAKALQPGQVELPRDLGAHDDYQIEWWYYTGNLQTANGREFGYQLTFFRQALTPPTAVVANDSAWRSNQLYMAHFTVSDIANEQFYEYERFSRGAAGLAGAESTPYRVWLEDWSAVEMDGPLEHGLAPVQLTAVAPETSLHLTLSQTMPPILQGDGGLSAKSDEPGNASYYYSLVQQASHGRLRIGQETFEVTGISWKDHEYSSSLLMRGAEGWDWFSIQLDDGTAVMLAQIRSQDGRESLYRFGSYIQADGQTRPLTADDIQIEVTAHWQSPSTGIEYPAGWRLSVASQGLTLTAVPLMPNQELTGSTIYWEGAVAYSGSKGQVPVDGRGYIELTGYNSNP